MLQFVLILFVLSLGTQMRIGHQRCYFMCLCLDDMQSSTPLVALGSHALSSLLWR